jgi:hypothetical protein
MSKQLYEEALADVKKVKEVAEDNAKRAVIEAVTPRIRDLIEKQLFGEDLDLDEEAPGEPGAPAPQGDLITDLVSDGSIPDDAISEPDAEGKVTLDLDSISPSPISGVESPATDFDDEYEISLESVDALLPILGATKSSAHKELQLKIYQLGEMLTKFKAAGRLVRESTGFHKQIAQMISRVENMYGYVQESITDPALKNSHETKLETYFSELNKLQEQTMSKKTKRMNEADVTLKLTGLPDDVDLDSVGVDLVTGEEDDSAADVDLGGDVDAGAGDEGGDDELDLSDLGGDEDESSDDDTEEEDMEESRRLSDNTIVEIDEKMLRREIARMKALREETEPAAWGDGGDNKMAKNFGGGKDDGDAVLDHEPTTSGFEVLDEQDQDDLDEQDQDQLEEQDDLDEQDQDQMDEQDQDQLEEQDQDADLDESDYMDQLDQIGNKSKRSEYPAKSGAGTYKVADGHESATWDKRTESVNRRLAFEGRLQARSKSRASALKIEAAKARARSNLKKEAVLKREYNMIARRFNESVSRSRKLSKLSEKLQRKARSISESAGRAETKATIELRKKLNESNLFNAKLIYTNKLLQNESLSAKQKSQIIERLDDAKTVREAKLVYESLTKTLVSSTRLTTENRDRKVLGSGSRVARPASTQALNEGVETDRWAKLAGITK